MAAFAADGQRVADSLARSKSKPCANPAYLIGLFHPADRFVVFQGIETAIFIAVAVALVLATVCWIRRRVA
jgi:hypothetical protein